MSDLQDNARAQRDIRAGAIFRCFLQVGATGFGGVLPMAHHELVVRRKWLTIDEFTEILALCQVLPGPNIINMAIVFGVRRNGWRGASAALIGLMALPLVIVMSLATLYSAFSDVEMVRRATGAVASAAAGLLCAIAARMFWPIRRQGWAVAVVVLVAGGIGVLGMPLVLVLATIGPVSVALAAWGRRDNG